MDKLITYDSVEVSFRGRDVVRNFSVSVKPGEILGIVGESGSGKSTVIKAAMDLLGQNGMVTKGDIWFDDGGKKINIPDHPKDQMLKIRGAKIAMIFQDAGSALCPIRTIGNQIYETLHEHDPKITMSEAKERTLDMFSKLTLHDGERIWNNYPFELSGGMNQRVGIATAMLMHPTLLMADEPTSALDVSVQKQAATEMLRLRDLFGTAIILVTHDIGVVSYMSDSVLVMQRGDIKEYGPTKQVLKSPQDPYTKTLLGSVYSLRRN